MGGKSWGLSTEPRKPRLIEQVRTACRQKYFSHRTEKSYVYWLRQFILFHGKRHTSEIG
ncbi:MAG: phage integrase N-terminal SAM-like domain-containing protein [Candidatus Thiodiazotropha sp.]